MDYLKLCTVGNFSLLNVQIMVKRKKILGKKLVMILFDSYNAEKKVSFSFQRYSGFLASLAVCSTNALELAAF